MKQVVVIEEDDDTRFIIEFIIKELGYIALCFKNILSIDKIIEIKPDIILIDHSYLDGQGGVLCQKLKSAPSTIGIPIILMSTLLSVAAIEGADEADALLEKPFDVEELN